MSKRKNTGSFYTPILLSNFIVKYLKDNHLKDNLLSILEPSVGDGSFIEAFINQYSSKNIKDLTILDINKDELTKALLKAKESNIFENILFENKDFLDFALLNKSKYSLIIGNPPYIKSTLLSKEQITKCQKIHSHNQLSDKKINNIWTSFLLGGCSSLKEDGILSFVLPTDLLQVKYSEEIRKYLVDNFERIEIFTLDRFIFSDIEQHTMILFLYKKSNEKGTFFYQITDMNKCKYKKISSNGLMIYETKWTHYNLKPKEIKLLNQINTKLDRVNKFIDSKPGIVTGANAYFIINQSTVKRYKLHKYVKPIIQKSLFVKTNIELNEYIIDELQNIGTPMYLLILDENIKVDKNLEKYLLIGQKDSINLRYKCSIRNKWYCLPNISEPTEGLIFKRYHKIPKLLKNSAQVHVTDGAYKIYMKENYNIDSFIYSFFNIITLIFAELTGRKYGGGVIELIPSEFKNLPIYYQPINEIEFNKFRKNFNKLNSFNAEIYDFLKLTANEIIMLEQIYKKLIFSRLN